MYNLPFEKAKALKDAGFPQPEFEFGQRWWYSGSLVLILKVTNLVVRVRDVTGNYWTLKKSAELVYIPTEGELLAAIFLLSYSHSYTADMDTCNISFEDGSYNAHSISNTNPLECLADAYLILRNVYQTKTSEEAPG